MDSKKIILNEMKVKLEDFDSGKLDRTFQEMIQSIMGWSAEILDPIDDIEREGELIHLVAEILRTTLCELSIAKYSIKAVDLQQLLPYLGRFLDLIRSWIEISMDMLQYEASPLFLYESKLDRSGLQYLLEALSNIEQISRNIEEFKLFANLSDWDRLLIEKSNEFKMPNHHIWWNSSN